MSSAPCQVSTLSLGVDAEFELQGTRYKELWLGALCVEPSKPHSGRGSAWKSGGKLRLSG